MAEAEGQWRHRAIDELHRTILARMDASDRRAAEREKQREQQRAAGSTWDFAGSSSAEHEKRREELRAKLAAYGLREVSSDEMLASVKRLSDTVVRVLEARQRSAGTESMAEPEWKGRVDRLDEVTIVHARIMERLEQKYDEAIRRHDEESAELRSAMLSLNSALAKTNAAVEMTSGNLEKLRSVVGDGIAELRATQVMLMKTFDQFIRGQEGNGRKQ